MDGGFGTGHRVSYRFLPSAVTLIRVLTVPLFAYTIDRELRGYAIAVFLFLCFTDLVDGYVARKLDVSSPWGAYFDVFADFLMVMAALMAFAAEGTYPLWTVLIVTAMFVQFLVTSRLARPVYDPVGKYYGGALFAMILLTLLFRTPPAHDVLLVLFVLYTAAAVVSRVLFLAGRTGWAGRLAEHCPLSRDR